MKLASKKFAGSILLSALVAGVTSACSESQDAEVVDIPQQSEEVRRVLFDKDGVVEIRKGEDIVFSRESEQDERLPRGGMPEADLESAEVSRSTEESEDVATEEVAASTADIETKQEPLKPLQASHVPPKLTPSPISAEPLTDNTPATLEPLPPKVAAPIPKTAYAVQVGFFGQKSNAENLRDVLSNNDWPVKLIEIEKKQGKTFYLVVVPVRGNKDRATAAKAKILKQHKLNGIVIKTDTLPG